MIAKTLACGALAALLAASGASVALAQTAPAPVPAAPAASAPPVASPVIVYDPQRVIAQSAAGQDMTTKLNAIAAAIRTQLETEARAIEAERTRLQQTPAGQLESAATQQAVATLRGRIEALQTLERRSNVEMQATQEQALGQFSQALDPVIRAAVTARNAYIVLETGAVTFAVPGVDVTSDVITRLNAAVRTINVTRVTLPASPPAGTAAPAPRPGAAPTPTPVPVPAGPLPRAPGTPR
jgi:Skp family chaperone for outer membrane proteins